MTQKKITTEEIKMWARNYVEHQCLILASATDMLALESLKKSWHLNTQDEDLMLRELGFQQEIERGKVTLENRRLAGLPDIYIPEEKSAMIHELEEEEMTLARSFVDFK